MRYLHFHISRDVQKSHAFNFGIGDTAGVGLEVQWRSYQPNDDGKDPWMLSIQFTRWFRDRMGLHCFRAKNFNIIRPSEEIRPIDRLSLALHGRAYWCDDRGAKDSIWQFKYRNNRLPG